MKIRQMIGLTLAALCASSFAEARPPTVMNSPGYDARLQESHKALGSHSQATTAPTDAPATAPKRKKKHAN